jgi:hypothetical protein
MAYYSGVANNLADLLTALTTNMITEGWSNPATNIYSKGGVFVKIESVSSRIELRGGTGNSGTSLTGGPSSNGGYDGTVSFAPVTSVFTYPLNYHLHINTSPDEVYFFANDGDRWTWMCFGKSAVSGLTGSGNWYGATCAWKRDYSISYSFPQAVEDPNASENPMFFGDFAGSGALINTDQPYNVSLDHGFDGNGWSKAGHDTTAGTDTASSWASTPASLLTIAPIYKLMEAQPNAWNGESILIRIQSFIRRGSGKFSLVSNLEHCRFIRNTNYNSGDTIILGSDTWHVYPMVRKNLSSPTPGGSSPNLHSGTWAIAVRE